MSILMSIIALHLLAILAGRSIRELKFKGITFLVLLTLLLVAVVIYMLFTMENPEVGNY